MGVPSQVERVPIQDLGESFQGIGVFFQGVVVAFQAYVKNILFFQWKSHQRRVAHLTLQSMGGGRIPPPPHVFGL